MSCDLEISQLIFFVVEQFFTEKKHNILKKTPLFIFITTFVYA